MKSPTTLLLALALSAPLASLPAWAADAHEHGHGHVQALKLNAGKKWGTDEPLRLAMTRIHAAVSQTLPTAHAGKASAADYDAFGKEIETQIAYMVENCKLAPEADAQLHTIIANLGQGVEAAQGKHGEKRRAQGVVQVAQAANAYGKYFDHSGWQAIKLPH